MISRQCINCLNLIESEPGGMVCLAFPEGIPEEIVTGEVDHSKPYPGDHGFLYDPAEPDDE